MSDVVQPYLELCFSLAESASESAAAVPMSFLSRHERAPTTSCTVQVPNEASASVTNRKALSVLEQRSFIKVELRCFTADSDYCP